MLSALKEQHASALENSLAKHADTKAEHEAALASLTRDHAKAIEMMATKHAADLERALHDARNAHATELNDMRASHEHALASVYSEHATHHKALQDAESRLHILTSKVAEAQNALTLSPITI